MIREIVEEPPRPMRIPFEQQDCLTSNVFPSHKIVKSVNVALGLMRKMRKAGAVRYQFEALNVWLVGNDLLILK